MAIDLTGNSSSGSGSGTGNTTPTPTPTATQRGKVTSKFLNVRSGPATTNPKVAELNNGDIVDLFEKVSGFWRIGAGKYVSADFIQVLAPNGVPTPSAGRKGKVTSSFLNVRTGPATTNAKVGELKQGALVTIFETSSNGWHRIGDKRWVIGTNVQEV
jgi:N-acetylmuramoyl-L-alanine amidase